MEERDKVLQGAGGGQPSGQPPQSQGEVEQKADNLEHQYITKKELEEALEKLAGRLQAQNARVASKIHAKLAALQKAGIQATPEQAKALVEVEESEPVTERQEAAETRAGDTAQKPVVEQTGKVDDETASAVRMLTELGVKPEQVDPYTLEAFRMMVREGVKITPEDPEFGTIKGNTPFEYLSSAKQAIEAYKARKQREGTPARVPALAGVSAGTKPVWASMSPAEILEQYFRGKG